MKQIIIENCMDCPYKDVLSMNEQKFYCGKYKDIIDVFLEGKIEKSDAIINDKGIMARCPLNDFYPEGITHVFGKKGTSSYIEISQKQLADMKHIELHFGLSQINADELKSLIEKIKQ